MSNGICIISTAGIALMAAAAFFDTHPIAGPVGAILFGLACLWIGVTEALMAPVTLLRASWHRIHRFTPGGNKER